jgi:Kef-type K+ transport system membrane component KefB
LGWRPVLALQAPRLALDLRLSLLVLFGICWLATRSGVSILVAASPSGSSSPRWAAKRLARQVTGVAQGLFVPLYFVALGARIDVRDFTRHASLLELAALLVFFDVALHLAAATLTRQPLPAALAATVQLAGCLRPSCRSASRTSS